jgi:hypothetical protein
MLKNTRIGLLIAVVLSATLALVSCGGVGAAPLNNGSLAGVAVSVSPPTMTIATGTTQAFTATVINTGETGVAWLVNGFPGGVNPTNGIAAFGTIDKNGNYTAPPFIPIPPTVTITAVANANNSASGNASVSINGTPSPVSILPTTASVTVGGNVLFTATAPAGQAVNWLVDNVLNGNTNVGTLSPVPGNTAQMLYTAPLTVPGGAPTAQVQVTVQSIANPLEAASAVVTISEAPAGGAVVEIISPTGSPSVQAGLTLPFQASVAGVSDTTVAWQVDAIPGGNASVGTIATGPHDSALYTAPEKVASPVTVTVTAVSNAQPSAHASIEVGLLPAQPTIVTLTPDVCTNTDAVPVASQVNLTASVSGSLNQDVIWQVNKITGGNAAIGTIAQVGTTNKAVYTAPANIPNPATVAIGAVSVADPFSSATVPFTISATAIPKVVLSPTTANAYATGMGVDFTATVEGMGDGDIAVSWYVDGQLDGGGSGSPIGSIDPGQPTSCVSPASYDPPSIVPNPNQVSVTAATADGVTSPAAIVTILPPPLTVMLEPGSDAPQSVQVQPPDNIVQYTAVDSDPNDTINWTLTSTGQDCSVSNGSICGTLTPTGGSDGIFTAKYTAPTIVPANPDVVVTANSVADPSAPQTDNYNDVTISNVPPTININGPTSVQADTGPFSYTAVVGGANPTQLTWTLGCISDWDGAPNGNCQPQRGHEDGPGCITFNAGHQHIEFCGTGEFTSDTPSAPLMYTPPLDVSTAEYEQNSCTLNGNPNASIVPITVTMQASGCPQGVCSATACVTVTPP